MAAMDEMARLVEMRRGEKRGRAFALRGERNSAAGRSAVEGWPLETVEAGKEFGSRATTARQASAAYEMHEAKFG